MSDKSTDLSMVQGRNKPSVKLSDIRVVIKGGGDIGSGISWRLHQCGFRVLITEMPKPLAVRRKVAFCEAVYDGRCQVEGVECLLANNTEEVPLIWARRKIPLVVDPGFESKHMVQPDVVVDATLAKKNLGTRLSDGPVVIGVGPGFEVGMDVHFVVETNRGHDLGRLLLKGSASPNTGSPGPIMGITTARVLRAPKTGQWGSKADIGDMVKKGDLVGSVSGAPVKAEIDGVIRGLIRPGAQVSEGLKIGDIDPRGKREYCFTVSEKALAISGGVLEGIFRGLADRS
jgi:xanthine dehydrogenase accessory factor